MKDNNIKRHLGPGRILIGSGAVGDLSDEMDLHVKYLLMTDTGLAAAGIADRVADTLRERGVNLEVFSRVEADPGLKVVDAAFQQAVEQGCGGVVGLGGGSSMDAAKATAVRLTISDDLREFGAGRWVEGPLAPLYAVPTTAGTGSEVTRVAVITDEDRMEKMAIRGVHLAPRAAVLDPDLLAGLPPKIAAETGADALTHAVEAFLSLEATPMTDGLAMAAISLINDNIRAMAANPSDSAAALNMLVGSCLAGQAFSNASVGLAHSLGEPLGAYFHIPHGLACALYLPVVMDFARPEATEKLARLGGALDAEITGTGESAAAEAAVMAVRKLWRDIGLPLTYAEAGIDFELAPKMVDDVFPQFSTQRSPRVPTREEAIKLYNSPR